jgi:hypothetical protein
MAQKIKTPAQQRGGDPQTRPQYWGVQQDDSTESGNPSTAMVGKVQIASALENIHQLDLAVRKMLSTP